MEAEAMAPSTCVLACYTPEASLEIILAVNSVVGEIRYCLIIQLDGTDLQAPEPLQVELSRHFKRQHYRQCPV